MYSLGKYPNLVILQLIPKIALAPLFVVWLGISHLVYGYTSILENR